VSVPWLVSSAGYGVLWNSPARGRVESSLGGLPEAIPVSYPSSRTTWVAEAATQIDYYVTTYPASAAATATETATKISGRYASLLRRLAEAVGKPPPYNPALTLFWQCKLRYASQAEVLNVTREYVSRGLSDLLSMMIIGAEKTTPLYQAPRACLGILSGFTGKESNERAVLFCRLSSLDRQRRLEF
jgi:hypothetical protein